METLQSVKTKLAAANKDIIGFIESFVDDKSFVQTDTFVCSDNDYQKAPGDGVVSGFATVADTAVCLFAINSSVLKGSIGALNAKKITRAVNNAVRMDKPLIAVWDTSGARIAEGIECLEGYNSILRAFTLAYGEIPVISVIKGNNYGISAYVSGISDFVFAYDGSSAATASPLVLSAKTSDNKIGTAAYLSERGIITNIIKKDGLRAALSCVFSMFYDRDEAGKDDLNRVCKGLKIGASAENVIKEVFDKGSFFGVRDKFAPVAVTGFAKLGGVTVGVVATDSSAGDGRLTADACVKISEFLNTCENAECPVVFLTDCVGTERANDDAKLIREMSNLIYQVNSLDLDMFSVVTGKAIGAAYTALVAPCEYKIAWEGAEIGALESEAAARLMYADEIKSAKDKDKAAAKLASAYSQEAQSALELSKLGYFDNVTEPNLTRSYLIAALLAHVE